MSAPREALVHGLGIEDYHSGLELSNSQLTDLAACPALFFANHRDPERPIKVRTETSAQLHGNLAHCAFLEPHEFSKRYVSTPDDAPRKPTEAQWNAKKPSDSSVEAMEWWSSFQRQSVGKQIVTREQEYTAQQQAKSLRGLPSVWGGRSMADLLIGSTSEVSAFWTDAATGVRCRCRPDLVVTVSPGRVLLVDVKTFSNCGPREFLKQVHRMRYHVQAAFYSEGYARASGLQVIGFTFVVVEDSWPFLAASYDLGAESMHEGELEWRGLLDTYAECTRSNVWPGYTTATQTLELPSYALTPQDVEVSYAT